MEEKTTMEITNDRLEEAIKDYAADRTKEKLTAVLNLLTLGRNGAGEGHVEILLPADERAVRPAEGDKMPPVAEGDGDGRKLRLGLEVDLVYIIHDPHLAEALACRKGRDALSTATLKSGVSVLRCRHVCRCGRIPTARYRSCLTRYVVHRITTNT